MMNIVEIIRQETQCHKDKPALREGSGCLTYRGLFDRIDQTADMLKQQGVKRYCRVALLAPEDSDYIIMNLAVLSLGAVLIPVSVHCSQSEVRQILEVMKVEIFIFEQNYHVPDTTSSVSIVSVPSHTYGIENFSGRHFHKQHEFESLNPAFIRFTSGTTGESKGVVLSHETIAERTAAADQVLNITSRDVVFWILPMAYHFVVTILLFLRRGACVVLSVHDGSWKWMTELSAAGATFIYAGPSHYQTMVRNEKLPASLFAEVRIAVSTTAALNSVTAEDFKSKFGLEISPAYGLIEMGLPFIQYPAAAGKRLSVGTILPGYESRLTDKDESGVGTVCLKGPGMFDAYFYPWRLRDEVLSDGWFSTGDIGRMDSDGFLYLLGRKGQVINFMGMKIYTEEVKNILESHPQIAEVFISAESHPLCGEIPKARIVPEDSGGTIDLESVRKFCYQKLASYKVPKIFECVDSLKKTRTNKVMLEQ